MKENLVNQNADYYINKLVQKFGKELEYTIAHTYNSIFSELEESAVTNKYLIPAMVYNSTFELLLENYETLEQKKEKIKRTIEAATKAKISKNNANWLEKYNPFNIIKSILNYEK